MSAPFPGVPAFPFGAGETTPTAASTAQQKLGAALAALAPPRILYQHYFATREASADLMHPAQGFEPFLRTFFHVKSGNWPGNQPHPLASASPDEFAKLPRYYLLERGKSMPENVAPFAPSAAKIAACQWLTDAELDVYIDEYRRTGFQGALQGYRVLADPTLGAELRLFSGRTIDVPSLFIGGEQDWATYVSPGALEQMQTNATTAMRQPQFVAGAGHWIQQEKPEELAGLLVDFASDIRNG